MLLSEYDEKKVRENWRQEGWESGVEEGRRNGLAEGRREGIRILITSCQSMGATYDQTLQQVMKLYELKKEEAEGYLRKYW